MKIYCSPLYYKVVNNILTTPKWLVYMIMFYSKQHNSKVEKGYLLRNLNEVSFFVEEDNLPYQLGSTLAWMLFKRMTKNSRRCGRKFMIITMNIKKT